MPASRATASIETAWNPRSETIRLVASSSCSRRSLALILCGLAARAVIGRATCYTFVGYGYVTPMDTNFDVDVAIIGSGFSGLGMAIRLKQEGIDDFTVLERGHDVVGPWYYNTYPGCACA